MLPAPSALKAATMLGVLFGVIVILELVASYVMKIDATSSGYGIFIFVFNYLILPALFIYMACNNFKKENGGFISFGQCLKVGVLVCVIAGVISGIASGIFQMVFPEYMVEMMDKAKDEMMRKNPDMTQEQLDMGISMMQKFSKPYFTIPFTIVIYAFVGLIWSLIMGAIVKKDRPMSF